MILAFQQQQQLPGKNELKRQLISVDDAYVNLQAYFKEIEG